MLLQHTWLSYNKELYPHYYLSTYLPRSAGRDTLSYSLLKFKRSQQPDLESWIDCALELFSQIPLPPGATLVRALHHDEINVPDIPQALDLLGQKLASHFRHYYYPRLLRKTHPILPIKTFTKPRREEELQGLYTIDLPSDAALDLLDHPPPHWLIIDDILTSGATARAIIQAIRQLPIPAKPISIFTLARADISPLADIHSPF